MDHTFYQLQILNTKAEEHNKLRRSTLESQLRLEKTFDRIASTLERLEIRLEKAKFGEPKPESEREPEPACIGPGDTYYGRTVDLFRAIDALARRPPARPAKRPKNRRKSAKRTRG